MSRRTNVMALMMTSTLSWAACTWALTPDEQKALQELKLRKTTEARERMPQKHSEEAQAAAQKTGKLTKTERREFARQRSAGRAERAKEFEERLRQYVAQIPKEPQEAEMEAACVKLAHIAEARGTRGARPRFEAKTKTCIVSGSDGAEQRYSMGELRVETSDGPRQ